MHFFRTNRRLPLWVMTWFVLTLACAWASAMLQPRAMEIVCSGHGTAKLLTQSANGTTTTTERGMDCPACLPTGTPAPMEWAAAVPVATAPATFPAPAAHRRGTPAALGPPARAPPVFS